MIKYFLILFFFSSLGTSLENKLLLDIYNEGCKLLGVANEYATDIVEADNSYYEFAGWFKEPECVNFWNFEVDIVPTKEYTPGYPIGNSKKDKENYIYKETALYAKWIEI